MNQYQPPMPRPALAVGAIALTAMVLGLSIVVPANLESDSHGLRTAVAHQAVLPAPTEGVIAPGRVDVIGVREPDLIEARSRSAATTTRATGRTAVPVAVARARCRSLANAKAAVSHST